MLRATLFVLLFVATGCSTNRQTQQPDMLQVGPTNLVLVSELIVLSRPVSIGVRVGERPSDVRFTMRGSVAWSFIQRGDEIELVDLSVTWHPRSVTDNTPATTVEATEHGKMWEYRHVNGYGHVKHLAIHTWVDTDNILHVEPYVQRFTSYRDEVGPHNMPPILIDLSSPPPRDSVLFSGVVFVEHDGQMHARSEGFHDWMNDAPTVSEVRR